MKEKIDKDELKNIIKISEAIEKIYPIFRSKGRATANCPFHADKSPSLSIVDSKGFFHCFGCGESGDMYDFYMRFLKISFSEALNLITEKFGYERAGVNKDASLPEQLNLLALKLYQRNVITSLKDEFEIFLRSRRLSQEIAKRFSLGITGGGNQLSSYLATFEPEKRDLWRNTAITCGLIYQRGDRYVDSFKNRIIFPIFNRRDILVGFSSRIYREGEKGPKYKNSPTSDLFKSSEVLYGENLLDRKVNSILLVEGFMDVISLSSRGIPNVIGLMGLNISDNSVTGLLSNFRNIYLGLDSDEAGKAATKRISLKFLGNQYLPTCINWSPYKDGDDYIKNSSMADFKELLNSSKPAIEVLTSEGFEKS